MNTDAQRRATAAFVEKRKAAGYRKVTLWLSHEAHDALRAWADGIGSKDKAANAAILAWNGPGLGLGERVAKAMAEGKPAKTLTPNSLTALRAELQLGPTRPKYGERSKAAKGKK